MLECQTSNSLDILKTIICVYLIPEQAQDTEGAGLESSSDKTRRFGMMDTRKFSILGAVTRMRTGKWPRMLYYCAFYTSSPVDYTWTVYIYITKDSATYKHRIKEDTKYSERTLNSYTVGSVNHTIDYFTLDISMNNEEKSSGWRLPPHTINPIKIPRRRIDNCHGLPMPANFKIILDASKSRKLCNFIHGYKFAGMDQENLLMLCLSPPVLPGKCLKLLFNICT